MDLGNIRFCGNARLNAAKTCSPLASFISAFNDRSDILISFTHGCIGACIVFSLLFKQFFLYLPQDYYWVLDIIGIMNRIVDVFDALSGDFEVCHK